MIEMKTTRIDAKGIHYTPLNQKIRAAIADGAGEIILDNVLGQRFIGTQEMPYLTVCGEGKFS